MKFDRYGKIKFTFMDTANPQVMPAPPNLTKSLLAGFDAVSSHIGLILFPLALDVFLWLGPKLPAYRLFEPFLAQVKDMPNQELIAEAAKRFNLFGALRSLPVGVPSLMASRNPIEAPLGSLGNWQVSSLAAAGVLWLVLGLVGILIGTLYFMTVSQAAVGGGVNWTQALNGWPRMFIRTLALTVTAFGLLFAISLPFACIFSLAGLIGLPISGFLLIGFVSFLAWFLFPLFFTPHGIFLYKHSLWGAARESSRLVRRTFPASGLFILSVIILSEGLDMLWRLPAEKSWMCLVGIAGHAFVNASLLAASFVFYAEANQWLQRVDQQTKFQAMKTK
jgi:hypothetical protein